MKNLNININDNENFALENKILKFYINPKWLLYYKNKLK